MSDDNRFVILQGPEGLDADEYQRLADMVGEVTPDDMDALIIRGDVETLSKDDLSELLTNE